jgi:uncharacterized protein (DUF1330 family)
MAQKSVAVFVVFESISQLEEFYKSDAFMPLKNNAKKANRRSK